MILDRIEVNNPLLNQFSNLLMSKPYLSPTHHPTPYLTPVLCLSILLDRNIVKN